MAEIVNLRRMRKRKARDAAAAEAGANRIAHGVAKHLRNKARTQSGKESHELDSHKLSPKRSD